MRAEKILKFKELTFASTFFYKNTLYKNTEAQIIQKLRAIQEQWPGWKQGSKKKLQEWDIDQINWNLTHKWAMNEQNAQAQKKLSNKIKYMPSKPLAET